MQKAELIARLENAKKKRLNSNKDQPSEEEFELSSAIEDLDDGEELDNSLKDKLFAESLIAQLSLAEWNKLSELERQQKILEMKKKERRLRKEGRVDEANQLLQEAFNRVSKLDKVTGDAHELQKAKIRERIANARKKKGDDDDPGSVSELESLVDSTSEVLELLDDKFAALRDKLFDEMGKSALRNLSEAERQRTLMELKKREKQLRQKGLQSEADELVKGFFANDALLKQCANDGKQKRISELKARLEVARKKKTSARSSEEETALINEIEELAQKNVNDPFALMSQDYESEKAALLGQFLQWQSREDTEKLRQLQVMKLRLDKKKIDQEDNYQAAAQIYEMMKLNQTTQDFDSNRQRKLARARIAAMKASRTKSQLKVEVKEVSSLPAAETEKEALLLTMDQRHHDEANLFVDFLQSDVPNLNESEMKSRFKDLLELRSSWRKQWAVQVVDDESLSKDEADVIRDQLTILKEMTVITGVVLKDKSGSDDEEVKVSLLTRLQELQEAERTDKSSNSVGNGDLNEEQFKLKYPNYDNIVETVEYFTKELRIVVPAKDEISVELEKKYDAMKDVMVMEGLMKQYGVSEWANMTERERQAKLLKVKMQERRLKQEGKNEEAAALLNKLSGETEAAKQLFEQSKQEQKTNAKERIRRKLELKKLRMKEGKDASDAALDVVLDMEEAEKKPEASRPTDVAAALEANFEEERKAILASLQSKTETVSADKVRQLELAKMRMAKAKMKRDGKMDAAAVVFERARLAEKGKTDSFGTEQERQKKLAQERIRLLREKRVSKENRVVDEQKSESIQESILKAFDEKQTKQAQYLVDIVNGVDKEKLTEIEKMKISDVKETLEFISSEYDRWKSDKGSEEELGGILKSAAFHKIAELIKLEGDVASMENVIVTLMTALQERQSKEQRTIEEVMVQSEVNSEEFLEYYKKSNEENWRDDVASVLLTPDVAEAPAPSNENLMKELNEELEQEKENLKATSSPDQVDYSSELKRLEEQHASKRRAMQAALSRQKSAALQKLAARKAAKELKDDDANAAASMVAALKEEQRKVAEQQKSGKERQKELMKNRLAARKRARLEEKEKGGKQSDISQEALGVEREDSVLVDESKPEEKPESPLSAITKDAEVKPQEPVKIGLDTETSFISVASSESSITSESPDVRPKAKPVLKREDTMENEQAMLKKLEREQTTIQMRTIKEIQQSKDRLSQRLERLKRDRDKKGEFQDKAKEILGLGERQKTMLETMREEERERATTNVRERIEKVKTERTKTMKERRENNSAQFKEMVEPAQLDGLSESDKMTKIAQILQEKMLVQEKELREGKRKIMVPEADDVMLEPGVGEESGDGGPDIENDAMPASGLLTLPADQDLSQSVRARSSNPRRLPEDKMKQLRERRQKKIEERAKSSERGQENNLEEE